MKNVIKSTTAADMMLLVLLIFGSFSGFFFAREAVSLSSDVVIESDGKVLYTLPLASDRVVSVPGPYGPTFLEVKNGKVRVSEAHCPNELCARQGWVSKGAIVCLPNRIVVTVGGSSGPEPRVDAITG